MKRNGPSLIALHSTLVARHDGLNRSRVERAGHVVPDDVVVGRLHRVLVANVHVHLLELVVRGLPFVVIVIVIAHSRQPLSHLEQLEHVEGEHRQTDADGEADEDLDQRRRQVLRSTNEGCFTISASDVCMQSM